MIVIGSSGFIGSGFAKSSLVRLNELFLPSSKEVNILNLDSLSRYLDSIANRVVVNLAGYTDVKDSETQKGDKTGNAWKINACGPRNIAIACKSTNKYLIHVSTDQVFPVTPDYKGPYLENTTPPGDLSKMTWYGYTKLMGEREIQKINKQSALVRILSPFGKLNPNKDLVLKLVRAVKSSYPLFSDQQYNPTYLPDLYRTLLKLSTLQKSGVFHVGSSDLTTPYLLGLKIARELKLPYKIKKGSLAEYGVKTGQNLYAPFGGLNTKTTRKILKIRFRSCQEALDNYLPKLQGYFLT